MPSFTQHLAKTRANLEFVTFLVSSGKSFDWATTGYFYSAVHLVEAYFDRTKGLHCGNHSDRKSAIVLDAQISHLYSHYRQLETYSKIARYGVKKFDLAYVSGRVQRQFLSFSAGIGKISPDLRV